MREIDFSKNVNLKLSVKDITTFVRKVSTKIFPEGQRDWVVLDAKEEELTEVEIKQFVEGRNNF